MSPTRERLLTVAQAFCSAFSEKKDVATILSFFSTTHQPTAFEHGEPKLAPFLGRAFTGLPRVQEYFEIIGKLLTYTEIVFSEFVVDTETSRVALTGKGTFTWRETGETWSETFAYVLDFDHEVKITEYQIWADTGSAYLARIGKLKQIREGAEGEQPAVPQDDGKPLIEF